MTPAGPGTPKQPHKKPDYDPPFEVHRIKKVEVTDRMFEFPKRYDFEEVYNRSFGIWKEGSFKVEVEVEGESAEWVQERMWSPDQKITKMRGGKIKIVFTASSDAEVVNWLLSCEHEARLIKPYWLVEKVKDRLSRMQRVYN